MRVHIEIIQLTRIHYPAHGKKWQEGSYYAGWIVNYKLNLNNNELLIILNFVSNKLNVILTDDNFVALLPRRL